MSNVIDLFEDDRLRASDVLGVLAERLEGEDAGVACVVLLYSADRPSMLVEGNVEDGAVDAMLGTAIVQLAADRLEEDHGTVH